MIEKYVSCIGSSMARPMVELCKILDKKEFKGINRVQCASNENGLACSIIILAVSMFESGVNRAMYIGNKKYDKPLTSFKNLTGREDLFENLRELYVLRDCIVHNHMWKISIPDPMNLNDPSISFELLSGYGDKKFKHSFDKTTMKTRILSLNAIPQKIHRADVALVLDVVLESVLALNNVKSSYFPIEGAYYFWHDEKPYKFKELIKIIVKNWRTST